MYKINVIAVEVYSIIDGWDYPDSLIINTHAIDVLKKFQDRGGKVILWTYKMSETDLDNVIKHLKDHYDFVPICVNAESEENNKIYPKVYADLYIDDHSSVLQEVDWYKIDRWINLKKDDKVEPDWNKIKDIRLICTDFTDEVELFECFGYDILVSVTGDSLSLRDSIVLFRRTMPLGSVSYGVLEYGYGSCTTFDSLGECETSLQVEQYMTELMDNITWFYTEEDLINYINTHDWGENDIEMKVLEEFTEKVYNVFGREYKLPMNIRREITNILKSKIDSNEIDPISSRIVIFGPKKLEEELSVYFFDFIDDEFGYHDIATYFLYEGKLLGMDIGIILSDEYQYTDKYTIKVYNRGNNKKCIKEFTADFIINRD